MNKRDVQAVAQQDQAEAWARNSGGPLLQPVDTDGPPVECGCMSGAVECPRDAAYVITMNPGTDDAYRMSACEEHLSSMLGRAFPNGVQVVNLGRHLTAK